MSNSVDHRAMKMIEVMRKNRWSINDIINNGFLEKEMSDMANDLFREELGYPLKFGVEFITQQTFSKIKKMVNDDTPKPIEIPGARVYEKIN